MKKIILFILALMLVMPPISYGNMNRKMAGIYYPVDYESITVAATAIGFTSTKISPTDTSRKPARAVITAETAEVRFRIDGTDPTSAEGHVLGIGDVAIIKGSTAISNFRAIRTGSTSGVLKVTYGI